MQFGLMDSNSYSKSILFVTCCLSFLVTAIFASVGFAKQAPHFWLSNLEGQQFNSRKTELPYVVSFFFVGCPPCRKEIPELYQLLKPYEGQVNLLFIDPLKVDDTQRIRDYAAHLMVPEKFFYFDALGSVAKKFVSGEMRFPTLMIISEERILIETGALDEVFKNKLAEIMNGGSP